VFVTLREGLSEVVNILDKEGLAKDGTLRDTAYNLALFLPFLTSGPDLERGPTVGSPWSSLKPLSLGRDRAAPPLGLGRSPKDAAIFTFFFL